MDMYWETLPGAHDGLEGGWSSWEGVEGIIDQDDFRWLGLECPRQPAQGLYSTKLAVQSRATQCLHIMTASDGSRAHASMDKPNSEN